MNHFEKIAAELQLTPSQVETTVRLLDEGATVPFLARYRKEATGSLDEVAIANVRDRVQQLRELDQRRDSILKSLETNGHLTDELREKVEQAETLSSLEDLYLPYRPKRRTRATIAKEKGLEPLAYRLYLQDQFDLTEAAQVFIDPEKGVTNVDEALAGARDILAEQIAEEADARAAIRELFLKEGTIRSRVVPGKEEEGQKYKDYFEWEERLAEAPSHRVLALRRGEKESILLLDIEPEEEEALNRLERHFIHATTPAADQMRMAIKDGYKRLMKPSLETEVRLQSKLKADETAIRVFADNLRELLLTAPLGQKRVLALDPGFRTGCKVVCLDAQGKLLHHTVIYPHEPQRQTARSEATLKQLVAEYNIEAIAIGNGTASRETETFVRGLDLPGRPLVVVVNESGASIYSASAVAREEFPDQDVTVRGAVSIGRRLMDPLAELVKIDAKSIGVGQYQHDVDQTALKNSLDETVVSCVSRVGVEVNTASKQLLTYVAGLGPSLANNIVTYRNEHGPFPDRQSLKKVPRLGEKAFEQAAGFLRIRGGESPLDASAVHPESYPLVEWMANDLGCDISQLMRDASLRQKIDLNRYVTATVGLPTLRDILDELAKPGRDPREQFQAFQFTEGVNSIQDLRVGMRLPGIVTNVTAFGAFVDVGVHQDGLVHISQLADRYVGDPNEVVKVQQQVEVTVIEVDVARKRISLSMKKEEAPAAKDAAPKEKRDKGGRPTGKPQNEKKGQGGGRNRPERSQKSDLSMEEKLAMLRSKFGKE
ncbi:uncharacterized protein SAMN05421823_111219 [Catalinimonas alkaloidigena]|uniref:S1 motif domain-containing protein n=1 Tax=Catalinimonas alkaloidigena TaxID=1075417 RepID=A0A1G9RP07_9BACT|nr:Tex family protein [Catalinimonas alkaloidigena]SDM24933.1 uncharacterized protein SAMN05421823_111219 [Catalinimonas alkaloidigena]